MTTADALLFLKCFETHLVTAQQYDVRLSEQTGDLHSV